MNSPHGSSKGAIHLPFYGTLLYLLLFASGCTFSSTESQANPNSPSANSSATVETEVLTPSAQTPALDSVTETVVLESSAVPTVQDSPTPENIVSSPDANAEPDSTAEPDGTAETDGAFALAEIVNQLGPICEPLTEATYQSQYLQFPDTDTTAYVKGQLHKVIEPDSPLRQADTADYCYPDQRATPEHALVIQQGGASILIDMEADPNGYAITTPVSFSADGRYLIAAVEMAYTGGDPGSYSIIFDLDRRDKLEMESYICTDADFDEYMGFTQPSEVAFRCSSYGGADNWVEILDLETRSIYKPTTEPEALEDYGTVTQPFQYTLQRR